MAEPVREVALSVFDHLSIPRRHQILGLLLIALGLLTALSLLTLPGERGAMATGLAPNACGIIGAHLARVSAAALGLIPALMIPLGLAVWGVNRLFLRSPAGLLARSLAVAALLFFLLGLLALARPDDRWWVGSLGEGLAVKGTEILGSVGTHLVLWTGLLVALLALLDLGLADVLVAVGIAWHGSIARFRKWGEAFNSHAPVYDPRENRPTPRPSPPLAPPPGEPMERAGVAAGAGEAAGEMSVDFRRARRAERERLAAAMISDQRPPRVARPEELAFHPGVDAQAPVAPSGEPIAPAGAGAANATEGAGRAPGAPAESRADEFPSGDAAPDRVAIGDDEEASARTPRAPSGAKSREKAAAAERAPAASDSASAPRPRASAPRPSTSAPRPKPRRPSGPPVAPEPPRPRGTDYVLPELSFLETEDGSGKQITETEILRNSHKLEQTLSHFDITGKVTEVIPGPVITRYAFEPAPGVKVNQIMSRSDDLALALRAHRLRILAPIPGKGAVGIEVPNLHPETVRLSEVVAVDIFKRPSGLLLALGKDVSGVPVVADLKKMPHLLIAGATGAGKSVCVNAIVTSLLCRKPPSDLRLVMVDPKMLELTSYNGIPHLLMPVVTEARMAAKALRYLVAEMLRRYERLARRGVRDIEAYNASLEKHAGLTPVIPEDEAVLPYIVVIIDELADLMLTLGSEIEDPIARLAQLARAVGIHLVLATQRPSVDVITGMIKANFPSRIAFQVASKVDSRTIMDQNGAEALLGRGDMLYLPAGRPDPVRIHGAFVSDREILKMVEYWKDFAPPTPALDVDRLSSTSLDGSESDENDGDDLFTDARRIVVQTGIGSTSLLQRRLKVGYARAGRLMDLLEQSGVVGPPDGSKAREVLMRPGDLPD
jgi:S-DNA-T family DNA segregation ATPase FtsK/SpoIIIE